MSKALSTLVKVFDPFLSWAATRYQANVGAELRKYGLRYEDLWDPLLNQVGCCTPRFIASLITCS